MDGRRRNSGSQEVTTKERFKGGEMQRWWVEEGLRATTTRRGHSNGFMGVCVALSLSLSIFNRDGKIHHHHNKSATLCSMNV